MSTPTPGFSGSSDALVSPELQQTAVESEEASSDSSAGESSVVTSKILPLSNSQMALLRGVSDSCAAAVSCLAETFSSTKLSDSPGNPAETLSAKLGINFSSSSGSQSSSDPFLKSGNPFRDISKSAQRTQSAQDQLVSSTGKAALSLSTSQQSSQKGLLSNKPCTLTIFLPGEQGGDGANQLPGRMSLSPKTFAFTAFSKEIKETKDQSKVKLQEHKESILTNSQKEGMLCSPMEMFHKSLEENRLHAKDSTADTRDDKQDQQQRQQKHSDSQSDQEENLESSERSLTENKNVSSIESQRQAKPHDILSQNEATGDIPSTTISVFPKSVTQFIESESLCSPIAGHRITRLDILVLCAEIMKLLLKSRHNDSIERIESRKRLMEKAQKMVDSFLYQAKVNKWLSIGSATLGVFGASSP